MQSPSRERRTQKPLDTSFPLVPSAPSPSPPSEEYFSPRAIPSIWSPLLLLFCHSFPRNATIFFSESVTIDSAPAQEDHRIFKRIFGPPDLGISNLSVQCFCKKFCNLGPYNFSRRVLSVTFGALRISSLLKSRPAQRVREISPGSGYNSRYILSTGLTLVFRCDSLAGRNDRVTAAKKRKEKRSCGWTTWPGRSGVGRGFIIKPAGSKIRGRAAVIKRVQQHSEPRRKTPAPESRAALRWRRRRRRRLGQHLPLKHSRRSFRGNLRQMKAAFHIYLGRSARERRLVAENGG